MPESQQRRLGPQEEPGGDELAGAESTSRALVPTADAAQGAAIAALQNEITLLKARMSIDRFELPRMVEDKLQSLQELATELARVCPHVTFELYTQDPVRFQTLIADIKTQVSQLEIQLVTFTAAIDLEYPKISFFQKLAVTLIALVRNSIGEATLMRTLGAHPAKRKALLGATDQFRTLLAGHSKQISDVEQAVTDEKNKPVNQRTHDLLMQNKEYQTLRNFERDAQADYSRCKEEKHPGASDINALIQEMFKKWVKPDGKVHGDTFEIKNLVMKRQILAAIEASLQKTNKQMTDIEKYVRAQAEKELSIDN